MNARIFTLKNQLMKTLIGSITAIGLLITTNSNACTGGSSAGTINPVSTWQTQSVTNGEYFQYTAVAGETYYFTFCGNGGNASWDTQFSVLDNSGNQIAYNDDYCGLQSYLAWYCSSSGTYRILISEYYCNNAGGYNATFAYSSTISCPAAPYTPIISQDTILGICGQDSILVSANTNYSSWVWNTGATTSSTFAYESGEVIVTAYASTGCGYSDTAFVSLLSPNIYPKDTAICLGFGDSVVLDAYFSGGTCIQIDNFTEDNYLVADHNSYSGDDRGGIAVTPDYLYYVGDSYTVRMEADGLGNMTSLPRRDGIFSDLGSGQLYTLWSTTYNDFYSGSPYTSIDAIRQMDDDLNYGTTINLSQTINSGSSSMMAAGNGFLILWAYNGQIFYHIDLATGEVTNLGTGNIYTTANPGVYYYNTENWAKWGIAECSGGEYSIVGRAYYLNGTYVYSPSHMVRYYISSGDIEDVTVFSGALSDMACVTYSPWHERYYFHYEGSGLFGGSAETAGYADIEASGGSAPFGFNWNTGDTSQTILVHPSQTTMYSVTVTDGILNCEDSTNVFVNPVPVTTLSVTDVQCSGDSNGTVSASVTSGSPPFNYGWFNGDSSAVLNGQGTSMINMLPAGWYELIVTDTNGCISIDTGTIVQPQIPFYPILANVYDPTCYGLANGMATVLAAGGNPPYTYAWSSGGSLNSDSSLSAGVVTVTVTDSNGCVRILEDSLDQPDDFLANLSMTGTTCSGDFDGSATSAGVGGTMPYSYMWSGGSTSSSASNITSGYQYLTVTDGNDCEYVDSIEVDYQFESPVVPLSDSNTICSGFTLILNAGNDGTSYLWITGATTPTIEIANPGTYKVTVTNSNGCITKATTSVMQAECVGIAENAGDQVQLNIYPNPSNGPLNIEIQGQLVNALDLEISDISGRIVWHQSNALSPTTGTQTIDLGNRTAGIYYLRISSEGRLLNVLPVMLK